MFYDRHLGHFKTDINFFFIYFLGSGRNMQFSHFFRSKIHIYQYFPKIPSEMSFPHPYYSELTPHMPYEKITFFTHWDP